MLNLEPLSDYATFVSSGGDCVDRTSEIEPTITFTPGAESELVEVQQIDRVVDRLWLIARYEAQGAAASSAQERPAGRSEERR